MSYITFTYFGEVFGVSTTTVHRCIKMFTDAMIKKKEEIIYLPDDAEAAAIADRFEQKYSYPQAFAAIDGTHIPVTPPSDGYRDFINRKMYPSIILHTFIFSQRGQSFLTKGPSNCWKWWYFEFPILHAD